MADPRQGGPKAPRDLLAIAAATGELDADPRLGDAVEEALAAHDPLAAIARATASIEPTEDLAIAVFERLALTVGNASVRRPTSLEAVSRTGPMVAGFAAIAAAAAVLFSIQTQREVDATIVTSVLSVEVGE